MLLAMASIAGLLYLGCWQVSRAHEKQRMMSAFHTNSQQVASRWAPDDVLPLQYQLIRVQGTFLPVVLLLDNQHYQHAFGYDVLSPLLLDNGHVLLVDRGWVAGAVARVMMPEIKMLLGAHQLMGTAYYPSRQWLLGPALEKKRADLAVVELIDTSLISHFLHKPVYPFIMRLDKRAPSGFIREWAIVSMPPERHYAYAVQWFAMALVCLILFIALNCKKLT